MIDRFIRRLGRSPEGPLFNPWYDRDKENDAPDNAPEIRREQLTAYLQQRRGRASVLFVAEALGYQGGHFTGIAMTSERILLGHHMEKYGIAPRDVFRDLPPKRTSSQALVKNGMSEPTATIMWGSLRDLGIDPYRTVLWNAVPWHPFNPRRGLLSNRTPTREEIVAARPLLKEFLELFPDSRVVAVGRKCEGTLGELNVSHVPVRHPANGGAPRFREQVRELFNT